MNADIPTIESDLTAARQRLAEAERAAAHWLRVGPTMLRPDPAAAQARHELSAARAEVDRLQAELREARREQARQRAADQAPVELTRLRRRAAQVRKDTARVAGEALEAAQRLAQLQATAEQAASDLQAAREAAAEALAGGLPPQPTAELAERLEVARLAVERQQRALEALEADRRRLTDEAADLRQRIATAMLSLAEREMAQALEAAAQATARAEFLTRRVYGPGHWREPDFSEVVARHYPQAAAEIEGQLVEADQ